MGQESEQVSYESEHVGHIGVLAAYDGLLLVRGASIKSILSIWN